MVLTNSEFCEATSIRSQIEALYSFLSSLIHRRLIGLHLFLAGRTEILYMPFSPIVREPNSIVRKVSSPLVMGSVTPNFCPSHSTVKAVLCGAANSAATVKVPGCRIRKGHSTQSVGLCQSLRQSRPSAVS